MAGTKTAVNQKEVPQAGTQLSSQPAHSSSNVTGSAVSKVGRDEFATKKWSIEAKIGLWSLVAFLIIGIATLIATVASPEVRRFLHLEKASPAASEGKPPSPTQQRDNNQAASQSSTASPQPIPPTSPAEKAGIRDNATVFVHRASPQSGAHMAMVATAGNGEQEVKLGAAPSKLMFTPPDIVVDRRELPKNIKVSGQTLTVVRYTSTGFVVDDHKHWNVHFTVYMVQGDPAKQQR